MSSGFKVVVVKSDEQGNVDVKDLRAYTGMLPTLSHLMKDSDPEVLRISPTSTPFLLKTPIAIILSPHQPNST
jgi:hypothetical protein